MFIIYAGMTEGEGWRGLGSSLSVFSSDDVLNISAMCTFSFHV